jgi:hypothetical protein
MATTSTLRDLELGQAPAAPFLAVGHSLRLPALPSLAPARFPPAEQRADPTAPRTRLIKDVLRVGRWKVGQDARGQPVWWAVSRNTLGEIARQFQLAQSRGIAQNLVWGHGDPATKIVDPRDLIAPLDQVIHEGDTLWVSAYVSPQQARELRNPANKVSVRVMENWTDGAGRHYPIMLLHVAVVDQPVLDSQGPFVDLANHLLCLFSKGTHMALDYQRTFDAVNTLLGLLGLSLPETTTEDNFNDTLDMLVSMLEGQSPPDGEEDPNAGQSPGGTSESPPPAGTQSQMSRQIHGLARQVKDLCLQVAALRGQGGRPVFLERLKTLAAQGVITAREVGQLTQLGQRHAWDLGLLDLAQERQAIDMGRYAKRHANGAPPALRGVSPTLSPAEIQDGVKALGGRPVARSGT